MKNKFLINIAIVLALVTVITGCNQESTTTIQEKDIKDTTSDYNTMLESANNDIESTNDDTDVTELEVCFGDEGTPFVMHLYDNATVSTIASFIDTSGIRLPIYHYDDYENYEVMQYYDIPTRYEIPSEPETITLEKAGEVYFAEPNRIVLFYRDAEVSGEYTKIGYFDYSDEFLSAVENNPVLEGWGNKIVIIRKGQ